MELAIELFNTLESLEAKGMHKQADQLANTMIRMAQEGGWGIRNMPSGIGINQPTATNETKFLEVNTIQELSENESKLLQSYNANLKSLDLPERLKIFEEKLAAAPPKSNIFYNLKPVWEDLIGEINQSKQQNLFDDILKYPNLQKSLSLSNVDINYDLQSMLIRKNILVGSANDKAKALEKFAEDFPLLRPKLTPIIDKIIDEPDFDKNIIGTLRNFKFYSNKLNKPSFVLPEVKLSEEFNKNLSNYQKALEEAGDDSLKKLLANYEFRASQGDTKAKEILNLYKSKLSETSQRSKLFQVPLDESLQKKLQNNKIKPLHYLERLKVSEGVTPKLFSTASEAADDAVMKTINQLSTKFPLLKRMIGPGIGALIEIPEWLSLQNDIATYGVNGMWEDDVLRQKLIARIIGALTLAANLIPPPIGTAIGFALTGISLLQGKLGGEYAQRIQKETDAQLKKAELDTIDYFNKNPKTKIKDYLEFNPSKRIMPASVILLHPEFRSNKNNSTRQRAWQDLLSKISTIAKQAKQNAAQKIKDEQQKSIQQQQQMQQQMQMNKPMESSGYDYSASQQEYVLSSIDLELEHKRLVIAEIMNAIKNYEKEGNYKLADDTLNYTRKIFG